MPAELFHRNPHLSVAARVALRAQPIEDALRRMPLLPRSVSVVNQDLLDITDKAARSWPLTELLARLELFDPAQKELARNCNKTLVCEDLFFGLL